MESYEMKLNEIIVENKLDEVPASGLGAAAKGLGARVLNKIPSAAAKSKAANLAGQADLEQTANNLHREFNSYLGTQGKTMKIATGKDLAAFLKTKNHKTSAKISSGVLQKDQLNQILMTVSREAMAGQGGTTNEPESATYVQTKDQALKLNAKEKRRLIQHLEKSIKTKSTVVNKNFDKNQKLSKFGKVGK